MYYSVCDLAQGYLQIPVAEEDTEKLAFITHEGLFEFIRMPFGSTNAGPTFQRAMNTMLSGLTWQICLPFVDDVVVWGVKVHFAVGGDLDVVSPGDAADRWGDHSQGDRHCGGCERKYAHR